MHKPKLPPVARFVVFALALPLVAACSDDSTGPRIEELNQARLEVSQAFQQFFTENEGLASFSEFSEHMAAALEASIVLNLFISREASPGDLAGILRGSMAAFSPELIGLAESAAIPVAVLGTTFTYDPVNGYQPDPSREGAPPNGVRFILYDNPDTPTEIGYLDIIDASDFSVDPPTVDMSLDIVVSGQNVVSYNITGTGTETSGDLLATGFLSDGTDQLNFTADLVGSSTAGSTANFTLTFGDASIDLVLAEEPSGAFDLTATIDDGSNVVGITFAVDATGVVLDGSEVTLNDTPVAEFSGTVNEPNGVSITDPNGNPLSSQDRDAIEELFGVVLGATIFMLQLLAVGVDLIGLAFV